jgi:hypothetical protein
VIDLPPKKIRATSLELRALTETSLSKWVEKWLNWEITNFHYLCALNWISGRAFNSDVARYPVFPNLAANFRTCNDFSLPVIDRKFQSVVGVSKGMIAVPEIYFLPQTCENFEMMYNNRRVLEQCDNLDIWISKVFGTCRSGFSHKVLFRTPHPKRHQLPQTAVAFMTGAFRIDSDQRIIYCWPMVRNRFGWILSNGTMTFGQISIENDQVSCESSFSRKIDTSAKFFGLATGLALYSNCLTIVTAGATVKTDPLWFRSFRMSDDMCQVSDSRISRLDYDDSDIGFTPLTELPERINCFASCRNFDRTVACCDDGLLRIRSNRTGKKVATVRLDHEVAVQVLITTVWGLTVVKSVDSIFVFDVNGYLVKKVANAAQIRLWTTFRNRAGFDFVAYQDTDLNIRYFEAPFPNRLVNLRIDTAGAPLACMTYNWRTSCFTFIAESGRVVVYCKQVK